MAVAIDLGNYADIGDYASLVAKVKLWLDRDDLDAMMPTFIGIIEPYLNRTLRTPDMEAVTYPVATGGVFTLPADCLAVRGVSVAGRPLDAMSPASQMAAFGSPQGIVGGCATSYSIRGNVVTLAPGGPTGTVTATLLYCQRIPALTFSAPTNWLLTSHPDIYLYGTLAQAEAYIENPDRAAQWTSLFDGAVESLVEAAGKTRFGGPIRARAFSQPLGLGCRGA